MDQAGEMGITQNRKRGRDQGEGNSKDAKKGKKKSEIRVMDDLMHKEKSYEEFGDGLGVFDFPWLKEGVIYEGNEYFEEPEDAFAPCSYIDDAFTSNLDQSCTENLHVPTEQDQNLHCKKPDDDSLRSLTFQVDDLEPVDCIWSFAIDQPLDVGLNKEVRAVCSMEGLYFWIATCVTEHGEWVLKGLPA